MVYFVLVEVVVKAGLTMLKTVEVYTGAVTVSSSVAVYMMVTGGPDVGIGATGLMKNEVVPVDKTAPLLGDTPLIQLVVPEFTP